MEIAGLIRHRAVSVVEVVESFLRRIEAVNPAINAVVTLAAESAINEARAADARSPEVWSLARFTVFRSRRRTYSRLPELRRGWG